MKKVCSIACGITLLIFSSCSKNQVFSEYKSIDAETGWKVEDRKTFEVEIKDSESRYNVYVNVRQGDAYPYRNLFLYLTTEYPDGKKVKDTLECILADENNRWLGEGAGDLWDNTILFKQNARFPMPGKYKFTYEHAMRVDPLPMILDVGLTIEKAE